MMKQFIKNLFDWQAFKLRMFRIAVAFDQLLNTILNGYPDETMSSRLYRAVAFNNPVKKSDYLMYKFVNFLFSWQSKDHCKEAYETMLKGEYSPASKYKDKGIS